MFYLLFSHLVLTPAFLGWGRLLKTGAVTAGLSGLLFTGLSAVLLLLVVIAFFKPIDLSVEWVLLIPGWFFFFKGGLPGELLRFRPPLVFWIFTIIILFAGSFAPFILDHFGYYVPTIEWIKRGGWVQGVSQIDWTLGQMSFWHLLQAGFSSFGDSYLRLNTLLLLYFLVYVTERQKPVLYLAFPVLLFFVQSPSVDLPVVLFSIVLVFEILNKSPRYNGLLVFSVLIFCIKPTMLWAPLLAFIYAWVQQKIRWRSVFLSLLIGSLYLGKNLWVSGYPLFPSEFGAWLNFPWKSGADQLQISNEFALLKAFDMQYSLEELHQAGFWQKVGFWFTLPGIKGFMNLLLPVSLILLFVWAGIKRRMIYFLIGGIFLVKAIIVLAFSAQYRFFLEIPFIITLLILNEWRNPKLFKGAALCLSLIAVGFLSAPRTLHAVLPGFRLSAGMPGFKTGQLLKPATYTYLNFKKIELGDTTFYRVLDYPFTFDTPLPAVSTYNLKTYLELNYIPQPNGSGGFYRKPLSAEDRKKLEELLKP